jgi:hypothetical protein
MDHELTSDKFDKKEDTLCDKSTKQTSPFLPILALQLWNKSKVEWTSQISLWMNPSRGSDWAMPSLLELVE